MLDDDDEGLGLGLGSVGAVTMRSAKLPEGVRVVPSFLRSGRILQLSRNDFVVASGSKVVKIHEVQRLFHSTRARLSLSTSHTGLGSLAKRKSKRGICPPAFTPAWVSRHLCSTLQDESCVGS